MTDPKKPSKFAFRGAGGLAGGGAWRASQGARAKQSGQDFEDQIQRSLLWYRARGVMTVSRCYPPTAGNPRVIGGRSGLRYTGKADVDFVGTVGGIPLAFDAKSKSRGVSYKVPPEDQHQLKYLLDVRKAGGLAFYLMHDPLYETVWAVTELERLAAGERVTFAERPQQGIVHHHAAHVLSTESLALVATGKAPLWPLASLLRAAFPDRLAGLAPDLP